MLDNVLKALYFKGRKCPNTSPNEKCSDFAADSRATITAPWSKGYERPMCKSHDLSKRKPGVVKSKGKIPVESDSLGSYVRVEKNFILKA